MIACFDCNAKMGIGGVCTLLSFFFSFEIQVTLSCVIIQQLVCRKMSSIVFISILLYTLLLLLTSLFCLHITYKYIFWAACLFIITYVCMACDTRKRTYRFYLTISYICECVNDDDEE